MNSEPITLAMLGVSAVLVTIATAVTALTWVNYFVMLARFIKGV